ncbi:MAG: anhydro-N-acetylmuramic acid kinase [Pseudomonadota bacterium]
MIYTALGIMTGTSCDGADFAIIKTDGEDVIQHDKCLSVDFPKNLRQNLIALGQEAKQKGLENLAENHLATVTEDYTDFIISCLKAHFSTQNIDIIGFHGQTILHHPDKGLTVQIGDAQKISNVMDCQVIFDFRQADMQAGGQGAPFAPLYHKALLRRGNCPMPAQFVNVGGVANVTYYDALQDVLLGWDTGPGNGLSDLLTQKFFNQPYDQNGELAAEGVIHQDVITRALQHDFLQKPPPKSFDRHDFDIMPFTHLDPHDAIATALAFSVETIIMSDKFCEKPPALRLISGGGVKNKTFMNLLAARSACPVMAAGKYEMRPDAIEAECFAWLAVRSLEGLPLSAPSVTGAKYSITGGKCFTPAA